MKKYLIHFMSIDTPSVEDDGVGAGANFGIHSQAFDSKEEAEKYLTEINQTQKIVMELLKSQTLVTIISSQLKMLTMVEKNQLSMILTAEMKSIQLSMKLWRLNSNGKFKFESRRIK